jgi:hypothetical protein
MREYLEQQITARRQRLSVLERERSTLESELRAYEDALAQAGGTAAVEDRSKCASLSRAWISIFKHLLGYKHFNASEIVLLANRLHKEKILKKKQSPGSARAQLSLLTKKGIINRRGGGNYYFPDETRVWLQLRKNDDATPASLNPIHPDAPKAIGPELAARAQQRRVTPANPRPRQGET